MAQARQAGVVEEEEEGRDFDLGWAMKVGWVLEEEEVEAGWGGVEELEGEEEEREEEEKQEQREAKRPRRVGAPPFLDAPSSAVARAQSDQGDAKKPRKKAVGRAQIGFPYDLCLFDVAEVYAALMAREDNILSI